VTNEAVRIYIDEENKEREMTRRHDITRTKKKIDQIQWRSQDFLSIGPFPSGTLLRIGQVWAIQRSTGP